MKCNILNYTTIYCPEKDTFLTHEHETRRSAFRNNLISRAHQWTKALLEYMRSNLWSSLAQASAMAVVLLIMQTARGTLAMSEFGTAVGGW